MLPTEQLDVEIERRFLVGSDKFVPTAMAGLRWRERLAFLVAIPAHHIKLGALRVAAKGKPTDARNVRGLDIDRAAERFHLPGRGIHIVHPNIGEPHIWHACSVIRRPHYPGHRFTTRRGDPVVSLQTIGHCLKRPSHDAGIEILRGIRSIRHQLIPDGCSLAIGHGFLLSNRLLFWPRPWSNSSST